MIQSVQWLILIGRWQCLSSFFMCRLSYHSILHLFVWFWLNAGTRFQGIQKIFNKLSHNNNALNRLFLCLLFCLFNLLQLSCSFSLSPVEGDNARAVSCCQRLPTLTPEETQRTQTAALLRLEALTRGCGSLFYFYIIAYFV